MKLKNEIEKIKTKSVLSQLKEITKKDKMTDKEQEHAIRLITQFLVAREK